jgi:hypothetical protein
MDAGYYQTFPNLYVLFIGPSGVGKSTSSGIGIEILRDAKIQLNIFSDSITAAGLIQFMSLSTVTWDMDGIVHHKTPVMVYGSEIGTLITKRNNIEELTYILVELFNKLGDYESGTKTSGTITKVRKPCLIFFACCFPEWIDETLSSIALRSGFLGRMLTIRSSKKRFKNNKEMLQSDWKLRENLVHDLTLISNQYGEMIWSSDAKARWDEWTNTLPLDLTSDSAIEVQGFASRKAQYVQRLAMLHAIGKKDSANIVNLVDFEFGLQNVESCEKSARLLKVRPDYVIKTDKLRHVMLMLKAKSNSNLIPIRDITPRVFRQMSSKELDDSISSLCGIGFCELVGRKLRIIDETRGGE